MALLYVLGNGSMGTAMAVAMARIGHTVRLWGYKPATNALLRADRENKKLLPGVEFPDNITVIDELDGIETADAAILATPTAGIRATATLLAGRVPEGFPLACVSKGLESGTLLPLHEVVAEAAPAAAFVALSGPSHAEEISKGVPTVLVAASLAPEAARTIQDLTENSPIRIYTSDDLMGVELGGALKNVIAFAVGVVDGMGGGDNTKAALMTRGLTEIARLGTRMGARSETFAGISGVGDLIVTCCSMHSRNRRCGIYVGEGLTVPEAVEKVGMVVEGITAARCAHQLAEQLGVEMPITAQVAGMISGETTAKESVAVLLSRPQKHEIDSNWLEE